ncbi:unnamed protein product, partial [marine sediment metagenome]
MENNEPTTMPDELVERLKTTKNRAEIALLLIEINRMDLIYTVIEDLAYGVQIITDKFCVNSR